MPTFLNVKNNAASILAAGISAGATSLTVASGEGARFPTSNFHITIDNEILKCTSRSGDVLTVTRAQEGTSAAAHNQGAAVRLNITAKVIEELQAAAADKSCRAHTVASQTIPNATVTAIAFGTNSEEWDTDTIHDEATNNSRFTCKTAGVYVINGQVAFAATASAGRRIGIIRANGGNLIAQQEAIVNDASSYPKLNVTCIYNLAVNDYVELCAFQTTGGDLNTISADTIMSLARLA